MEEKPKSLRRNLMEHFDATLIKPYLDDAIKFDNKEFDSVFLEKDNQNFVRRVIRWASLNNYLSFPVSSSYILNELSRYFMASRVLFFWEKIRQAWKNKAHKLKKQNLISSHEEEFANTFKRLKDRSDENQLESCRKVKQVLVPLIVAQLNYITNIAFRNCLWFYFCALVQQEEEIKDILQSLIPKEGEKLHQFTKERLEKLKLVDDQGNYVPFSQQMEELKEQEEENYMHELLYALER